MKKSDYQEVVKVLATAGRNDLAAKMRTEVTSAPTTRWKRKNPKTHVMEYRRGKKPKEPGWKPHYKKHQPPKKDEHKPNHQGTNPTLKFLSER